MHWARRAFAPPTLLLLAALEVAGCQGAPREGSHAALALGSPVQVGALPASDIGGAGFTPGAVATVLYFAGPDCPIARAYSPEVARLAQRDGKRSIAWIMGFPEEGITAQAVRKYQEEYAISIPAFVDGATELCCHLGVTTIPSVVVLDAGHRIIYRGRLDNRYQGLGVSYGPPTKRDLDAVLDALSRGEQVTPAATAAVGCVLQPCNPQP